MATINDRENAFENKFAYDAEMQFKVDARRNKLLGFWAAELLEKSGNDAANYAKDVVKSYFEEGGHEAVYHKVSADLGSKADEGTIRSMMFSLMDEARSQVISEQN